MSWKNKFTYKKKVFAEQRVGDSLLRFYPNRIEVLTELAEVSRPFVSALATLFDDSRDDATSTTERYKDGDTEIEKISVQAVQPDVADGKRKAREASINTLVSAFGDKRLRIHLGRLLMDSLRDEFPYKPDRAPEEIEEFLHGDGEEYQGLDGPMLVEAIRGWAAANAKVFGSMGEKLTGLVKRRLASLEQASLPVDSPSTETNPVDGSSSKTPSSPESDTDSIFPSSNP